MRFFNRVRRLKIDESEPKRVEWLRSDGGEREKGDVRQEREELDGGGGGS